MTSPPHTRANGLSLAPFRALRPRVDPSRLAKLLCPPYDVIDETLRARLLQRDPDNAVAVVLPVPTPAGYAAAAARLAGWVNAGLWALEDRPALFVYEMRDVDGHVTRGLLGAVELRPAQDGVILPHENTMAGPVADRLEVMTRTGADLEPIYLVYDGGGPASEVVRAVDDADAVATALTPDGVTHRLWSVLDPRTHAAVADDLAGRRALIADGHHRYATYQERQRRLSVTDGRGPWDRGLALLVDSSDYGPQVHAIHRYIADKPLDAALRAASTVGRVERVVGPPDATLATLASVAGFAAILTDGTDVAVLTDPGNGLRELAAGPNDDSAFASLDVSVLHHALVSRLWHLPDDVGTVGYAHSVEDAVIEAKAHHGFAVLLRPTPVAAVAAVAAAGARMPRKSTLFTPKPASGLLMRRLADQT